MMDIREKLVELLQDENNPVWRWFPNNASMTQLADYLISNGVTVQERGYWASLTDCANAGVYCSVCHKKVYKEDYARCNRKNKLRSDYCPHCGSKMMPPPAEGE